MREASSETKSKILESAKKEFLQKGFVNASLRTIAANAGVTTGAMYRHFKDKDALFCALVDEHIKVVTDAIMLSDVMTHTQMNDVLSKEHYDFEKQSINELFKYIYVNFDAFKLLLKSSSGSTHENFLDDLCELYTKNCKETFDWMYKEKIARKTIDKMTVHFIASSFINAFAEIILHEMSPQDASNYISDIIKFTRHGTMTLLGIPCPEND